MNKINVYIVSLTGQEPNLTRFKENKYFNYISLTVEEDKIYDLEKIKSKALADVFTSADSEFIILQDNMVPLLDEEKIYNIIQGMKKYDFDILYLMRSEDRCDLQVKLDDLAVRPYKPKNQLGLYVKDSKGVKEGKKIACSYNLYSIDTLKIQDYDDYKMTNMCLKREEIIGWPYINSENKNYNIVVYILAFLMFILLIFLLVRFLNFIRKKKV